MATPGNHLAIELHRGEGPRGDVQIQDLVAELILHRVEGDTWKNIIELCVCASLGSIWIGSRGNLTETRNHGFSHEMWGFRFFL